MNTTNTMNETDLIIRLAGAARLFAKKCKVERVPQTIDLAMSISVAHAHRPIRLDVMNTFDSGNLAHDVFGINRHVNHMTGELMDCFVPRCGFQS